MARRKKPPPADGQPLLLTAKARKAARIEADHFEADATSEPSAGEVAQKAVSPQMVRDKYRKYPHYRQAIVRFIAEKQQAAVNLIAEKLTTKLDEADEERDRRIYEARKQAITEPRG